MSITLETPEGEQITLNSHKEVCPQCEGEGQHVNPAIDGNGITPDEMHELGEDFEQDYRTGLYDITCEECGGKRVVDEPDEDDPNYGLWIEVQEDEHEWRAEMAAERRMGA